MRANLKAFRAKRNLSQQQISDRIGVTRETYGAVENGNRNPKQEFWNSLQKAFNVADVEMWALTIDEEVAE